MGQPDDLLARLREAANGINRPSETEEWEPVEILPQVPNTAAVLFHHRHNTGGACPACEIVRLRRSTFTPEQVQRGLERAKQRLVIEMPILTDETLPQIWAAMLNSFIQGLRDA